MTRIVYVDIDHIRGITKATLHKIEEQSRDALTSREHDIIDAILSRLGKMKIGGGGIDIDRLIPLFENELNIPVDVTRQRRGMLMMDPADDNTAESLRRREAQTLFMEKLEEVVIQEKIWWSRDAQNIESADLSRRVGCDMFLKVMSLKISSATSHKNVTDHTFLKLIPHAWNCQTFYEKLDRYQRVFFPFKDALDEKSHKSNATIDLYCTNPTEQVRVFELDESRVAANRNPLISTKGWFGTYPSFNQVMHMALLSDLYDRGMCPNTQRVDAIEVCMGDQSKDSYRDPGDADLEALAWYDLQNSAESGKKRDQFSIRRRDEQRNRRVVFTVSNMKAMPKVLRTGKDNSEFEAVRFTLKLGPYFTNPFGIFMDTATRLPVETLEEVQALHEEGHTDMQVETIDNVLVRLHNVSGHDFTHIEIDGVFYRNHKSAVIIESEGRRAIRRVVLSEHDYQYWTGVLHNPEAIQIDKQPGEDSFYMDPRRVSDMSCFEVKLDVPIAPGAAPQPDEARQPGKGVDAEAPKQVIYFMNSGRTLPITTVIVPESHEPSMRLYITVDDIAVKVRTSEDGPPKERMIIPQTLIAPVNLVPHTMDDVLMQAISEHGANAYVELNGGTMLVGTKESTKQYEIAFFGDTISGTLSLNEDTVQNLDLDGDGSIDLDELRRYLKKMDSFGMLKSKVKPENAPELLQKFAGTAGSSVLNPKEFEVLKEAVIDSANFQTVMKFRITSEDTSQTIDAPVRPNIYTVPSNAKISRSTIFRCDPPVTNDADSGPFMFKNISSCRDGAIDPMSLDEGKNVGGTTIFVERSSMTLLELCTNKMGEIQRIWSTVPYARRRKIAKAQYEKMGTVEETIESFLDRFPIDASIIFQPDSVSRELHMLFVENALDQLKHSMAVVEEHFASMLFTTISKTPVVLCVDAPLFGIEQVVFDYEKDSWRNLDLLAEVPAALDIGHDTDVIPLINQHGYWKTAYAAKPDSILQAGNRRFYNRLKGVNLGHADELQYTFNGDSSAETVSTLPNCGFLVKLRPTRYSYFKKMFFSIPRGVRFGLEVRPKNTFMDKFRDMVIDNTGKALALVAGAATIFVTGQMILSSAVGTAFLSPMLHSAAASVSLIAGATAPYASWIHAGMYAGVGIAAARNLGRLFGYGTALDMDYAELKERSTAVNMGSLVYALVAAVKIFVDVSVMSKKAADLMDPNHQVVAIGMDTAAYMAGEMGRSRNVEWTLSNPPMGNFVSNIVAKMQAGWNGGDISRRLEAAIVATRDLYQPGYDLQLISNQMLFLQPYRKLTKPLKTTLTGATALVMALGAVALLISTSGFAAGVASGFAFGGPMPAAVVSSLQVVASYATPAAAAAALGTGAVAAVVDNGADYFARYEMSTLNIATTPLLYDIFMMGQQQEAYLTGKVRLEQSVTRSIILNLTSSAFNFFGGKNAVIEICARPAGTTYFSNLQFVRGINSHERGQFRIAEDKLGSDAAERTKRGHEYQSSVKLQIHFLTMHNAPFRLKETTIWTSLRAATRLMRGRAMAALEIIQAFPRVRITDIMNDIRYSHSVANYHVYNVMLPFPSKQSREQNLLYMQNKDQYLNLREVVEDERPISEKLRDITISVIYDMLSPYEGIQYVGLILDALKNEPIGMRWKRVDRATKLYMPTSRRSTADVKLLKPTRFDALLLAQRLSDGPLEITKREHLELGVSLVNIDEFVVVGDVPASGLRWKVVESDVGYSKLNSPALVKALQDAKSRGDTDDVVELDADVWRTIDQTTDEWSRSGRLSMLHFVQVDRTIYVPTETKDTLDAYDVFSIDTSSGVESEINTLINEFRRLAETKGVPIDAPLEKEMQILIPTTKQEALSGVEVGYERARFNTHQLDLAGHLTTSWLYSNGISPHFYRIESIFNSIRGKCMVIDKMQGDMYNPYPVFSKLQTACANSGMPRDLIPTFAQLLDNIIIQALFTILTFQVTLHGMHNDLHLASFALKIVDNTPYRDTPLNKIEHFVYRFNKRTYCVPNLGILVKLGNFQNCTFSVDQATRVPVTATESTSQRMQAANVYHDEESLLSKATEGGRYTDLDELTRYNSAKEYTDGRFKYMRAMDPNSSLQGADTSFLKTRIGSMLKEQAQKFMNNFPSLTGNPDLIREMEYRAKRGLRVNFDTSTDLSFLMNCMRIHPVYQQHPIVFEHAMMERSEMHEKIREGMKHGNIDGFSFYMELNEAETTHERMVASRQRVIYDKDTYAYMKENLRETQIEVTMHDTRAFSSRRPDLKLSKSELTPYYSSLPPPNQLPKDRAYRVFTNSSDPEMNPDTGFPSLLVSDDKSAVEDKNFKSRRYLVRNKEPVAEYKWNDRTKNRLEGDEIFKIGGTCYFNNDGVPLLGAPLMQARVQRRCPSFFLLTPARGADDIRRACALDPVLHRELDAAIREDKYTDVVPLTATHVLKAQYPFLDPEDLGSTIEWDSGENSAVLRQSHRFVLPAFDFRDQTGVFCTAGRVFERERVPTLRRVTSNLRDDESPPVGVPVVTQPDDSVASAGSPVVGVAASNPVPIGIPADDDDDDDDGQQTGLPAQTKGTRTESDPAYQPLTTFRSVHPQSKPGRLVSSLRERLVDAKPYRYSERGDDAPGQPQPYVRSAKTSVKREGKVSGLEWEIVDAPTIDGPLKDETETSKWVKEQISKKISAAVGQNTRDIDIEPTTRPFSSDCSLSPVTVVAKGTLHRAGNDEFLFHVTSGLEEVSKPGRKPDHLVMVARKNQLEEVGLEEVGTLKSLSAGFVFEREERHLEDTVLARSMRATGANGMKWNDKLCKQLDALYTKAQSTGDVSSVSIDLYDWKRMGIDQQQPGTIFFGGADNERVYKASSSCWTINTTASPIPPTPTAEAVCARPPAMTDNVVTIQAPKRSELEKMRLVAPDDGGTLNVKLVAQDDGDILNVGTVESIVLEMCIAETECSAAINTLRMSQPTISMMTVNALLRGASASTMMPDMGEWMTDDCIEVNETHLRPRRTRHRPISLWNGEVEDTLHEGIVLVHPLLKGRTDLPETVTLINGEGYEEVYEQLTDNAEVHLQSNKMEDFDFGDSDLQPLVELLPRRLYMKSTRFDQKAMDWLEEYGMQSVVADISMERDKWQEEWDTRHPGQSHWRRPNRICKSNPVVSKDLIRLAQNDSAALLHFWQLVRNLPLIGWYDPLDPNKQFRFHCRVNNNKPAKNAKHKCRSEDAAGSYLASLFGREAAAERPPEYVDIEPYNLKYSYVDESQTPGLPTGQRWIQVEQEPTTIPAELNMSEADVQRLALRLERGRLILTDDEMRAFRLNQASEKALENLVISSRTQPGPDGAPCFRVYKGERLRVKYIDIGVDKPPGSKWKELGAEPTDLIRAENLETSRAVLEEIRRVADTDETINRSLVDGAMVDQALTTIDSDMLPDFERSLEAFKATLFPNPHTHHQSVHPDERVNLEVSRLRQSAERLNAAEAEVAEKDNEIEARQQIIDSLKSSMQLSEQMELKQKQGAELQLALAKEEKVLETIVKQDDATEESRRTIANVTKRVGELKERLSGSTAALARAGAKTMKEMRAEMERHQGELKELRDSIIELKTSVAGFNAEKMAAAERVDALRRTRIVGFARERLHEEFVNDAEGLKASLGRELADGATVESVFNPMQDLAKSDADNMQLRANANRLSHALGDASDEVVVAIEILEAGPRKNEGVRTLIEYISKTYGEAAPPPQKDGDDRIASRKRWHEKSCAILVSRPEDIGALFKKEAVVPNVFTVKGYFYDSPERSTNEKRLKELVQDHTHRMNQSALKTAAEDSEARSQQGVAAFDKITAENYVLFEGRYYRADNSSSVARFIMVDNKLYDNRTVEGFVVTRKTVDKRLYDSSRYSKCSLSGTVSALVYERDRCDATPSSLEMGHKRYRRSQVPIRRAWAAIVNEVSAFDNPERVRGGSISPGRCLVEIDVMRYAYNRTLMTSDSAVVQSDDERMDSWRVADLIVDMKSIAFPTIGVQRHVKYDRINPHPRCVTEKDAYLSDLKAYCRAVDDLGGSATVTQKMMRGALHHAVSRAGTSLRPWTMAYGEDQPCDGPKNCIDTKTKPMYRTDGFMEFIDFASGNKQYYPIPSLAYYPIVTKNGGRFKEASLQRAVISGVVDKTVLALIGRGSAAADNSMSHHRMREQRIFFADDDKGDFLSFTRVDEAYKKMKAGKTVERSQMHREEIKYWFDGVLDTRPEDLLYIDGTYYENVQRFARPPIYDEIVFDSISHIQGLSKAEIKATLGSAIVGSTIISANMKSQKIKRSDDMEMEVFTPQDGDAEAGFLDDDDTLADKLSSNVLFKIDDRFYHNYKQTNLYEKDKTVTVSEDNEFSITDVNPETKVLKEFSLSVVDPPLKTKRHMESLTPGSLVVDVRQAFDRTGRSPEIVPVNTALLDQCLRPTDNMYTFSEKDSGAMIDVQIDYETGRRVVAVNGERRDISQKSELKVGVRGKLFVHKQNIRVGGAMFKNPPARTLYTDGTHPAVFKNIVVPGLKSQLGEKGETLHWWNETRFGEKAKLLRSDVRDVFYELRNTHGYRPLLATDTVSLNGAIYCNQLNLDTAPGSQWQKLRADVDLGMYNDVSTTAGGKMLQSAVQDAYNDQAATRHVFRNHWKEEWQKHVLGSTEIGANDEYRIQVMRFHDRVNTGELDAQHTPEYLDDPLPHAIAKRIFDDYFDHTELMSDKRCVEKLRVVRRAMARFVPQTSATLVMLKNNEMREVRHMLSPYDYVSIQTFDGKTERLVCSTDAIAFGNAPNSVRVENKDLLTKFSVHDGKIWGEDGEVGARQMITEHNARRVKQFGDALDFARGACTLNEFAKRVLYQQRLSGATDASSLGFNARSTLALAGPHRNYGTEWYEDTDTGEEHERTIDNRNLTRQLASNNLSFTRLQLDHWKVVDVQNTDVVVIESATNGSARRIFRPCSQIPSIVTHERLAPPPMAHWRRVPNPFELPHKKLKDPELIKSLGDNKLDVAKSVHTRLSKLACAHKWTQVIAKPTREDDLSTKVATALKGRLKGREEPNLSVDDAKDSKWIEDLEAAQITVDCIIGVGDVSFKPVEALWEAQPCYVEVEGRFYAPLIVSTVTPSNDSSTISPRRGLGQLCDLSATVSTIEANDILFVNGFAFYNRIVGNKSYKHVHLNESQIHEAIDSLVFSENNMDSSIFGAYTRWLSKPNWLMRTAAKGAELVGLSGASKTLEGIGGGEENDIDLAENADENHKDTRSMQDAMKVAGMGRRARIPLPRFLAKSKYISSRRNGCLDPEDSCVMEAESSASVNDAAPARL